MSTINASNLELQLVQKISSTTTELELLALSVALRQLQNGAIFVVQNFADLPAASANVGQLYFVVADARLYVSYAVGGWQLISTDSENTLWTWGSNSNIQLGNGTANRSSPGTTTGCGTNWCAVCAASYQTAAIKTDGTLWSWGFNNCGQLGDGTVVARSSPVTPAGGGTTWCVISAGYRHGSAVKSDGTLWTWGLNCLSLVLDGRLGTASVASRSSPGQTLAGGATWCSTGAGNRHTVGVKTDGTVWTWGLNNVGQLGDNSVTTRSSPIQVAGSNTLWCNISSGAYHNSAVKTDGTLWTWGYNNSGRLGDNSVANRSSPVQVAGSNTLWRSTSSGNNHTQAVKTDGSLWTWGNNTCGKLGDGGVTNRSSPGNTSSGGLTWCTSSAGGVHSGAVKSDGTLWTWGLNTCGRLGDNTVSNRSTPGTTAGGGTTWCAVSAGGTANQGHTAGIQSIVF